MSCSPFDLRDYFLQELPDPQQRLVETHMKSCQLCREELDRLRITEAALMSVREEEIPQRIAFVSDKIFEPSPWRRWWTGFWNSSARLGFAAAAILAVAIVARPVGRVAETVKAPPVTTVSTASTASTVAPVSEAEIERRIQAAVAQAVSASEARQEQKTVQLVADLERRSSAERHRVELMVASEMDLLNRKAHADRYFASDVGPPRADRGDLQ